MAAVAILADAVRRGATFRAGAEVAGSGPAVAGRWWASPPHRAIESTWTRSSTPPGRGEGVVGERLGAPIPVLPRRGFLLVTEPMPRRVEHKVYSADYVDNVAASTEGLETSCVVEGTQGGTILIGASRERVGFDLTMNPGIVRALAEQAVRIFPSRPMCSCSGSPRFSSHCPDHLPVIGPDPRACPGSSTPVGMGAGIGLATATGALIASHLTGSGFVVDPGPTCPTDSSMGGRHDLQLRWEPDPLRRGPDGGRRPVAAGIVSWRTTRVEGRPRGIFCGIGVCFDC